MALGGVATGNMKAKDVAMAVDAIRYRGFTLTFSAYLGKTKVKTTTTGNEWLT